MKLRGGQEWVSYLKLKTMAWRLKIPLEERKEKSWIETNRQQNKYLFN